VKQISFSLSLAIGLTLLRGPLLFSGPAGACPVLQVALNLAEQQPYPGPDPHPIPGKIEAEDYDTGGEGVAYHDTAPGNEDGKYRSDDVDIEETSDMGGGYDVGWIEAGEWLRYTVFVTETAHYDVQVRVASAMGRTISDTLSSIGVVSWTVPLTRTLHIEFDGTDVTGPLTFVATGGWQSWTCVFARGVRLTAGEHRMRLSMDSGSFNVNWVSIAESLPEDPIDWLISQMTVPEKIAQLHGIDWMVTADNTRLGIPGFGMADGPHGIREGKATSFPVGIAMAATWDPELVEKVGMALGKEARGKGRNQVMAVQQGGAWSIMNAYNWINKRPSSANYELLTRILRDEWGYLFYVVSDWGSIYTSAAQAVNAGCDLEMPHLPGKYPEELPAAIASGEVTIATLDRAVGRVLQTKHAAGLLDSYPPGNPEDVCSQEHRALALRVAQESLVLLKNEDHILPLDKTRPLTIALIGPSADVAQLDGRGSSVVDACYAYTPKQGIENRTSGFPVTIIYARGCDINSDDTGGFSPAIKAAQAADVVVFVGGLDNTQEGEEFDRASGSVQLPGQQQPLINALAAANPNIVVVLESGGVVALEQCFDSIKGLIYAFYPGQEGGNAIADILFGDVNPSGKLPVTMPRNDDQLPARDDLDFSGDVVGGFGYRRFDSLGLTPQYAFGYGLSYTTFEYGNLIVTPTSTSDDDFRIEAGIYTVRVGGSSDNLPRSGTFKLTSSMLYDSATGETFPARLPVLGNVALHRPATCSSIEGLISYLPESWELSGRVDGNLTTRWSSQFSDPQWIYVDLGAWQYIERVILHWETAYGKAYRLQTSNDRLNWTDIYSTLSGDGEVDNLDVSGAGRYVRVYGTQRGTGWGHSLWEFEVYARPNSIYLPLVMRQEQGGQRGRGAGEQSPRDGGWERNGGPASAGGFPAEAGRPTRGVCCMRATGARMWWWT